MNLLDKYQNQIEKLSNIKGVYGVYIFGSQVQGKKKPMSDLDVCFFINESDKNLFYELMSYKTKDFDINIFHKLPLHLQFSILKNGEIFIVKDLEKLREQRLKYARKYREEGGLLKRLMKKRYGVEI